MVTGIHKSVFGLFVVLVLSGSARAQSYYSQTDAGLVNYFISGQSAGMGGAGIAIADKLTMNFVNPAALINLPVSFLSGNFRHEATNVHAESIDGSISDTNIAGVQFHVPLRKERISLSLGVYPTTIIEYFFEEEGSAGSEPFVETVEGDGGINTAFLSFAIRPFSRLSLGISTLYHFGKLRDRWQVTFNEGSGLVNTQQEVADGFTTGNIRLGLQYRIRKGWHIGAVYTPSVTLNITRSVTLRNISKLEDFEKRELELPETFGVGTAFFLSRKLLIAADYYVERWSDVEASSYVNDSQRIGVGLEFSGRGAGIASSYWSKMAFRAGFYYRNLGIEAPVGESVTEVFGTIGVGFPMKWSASRIDLSLEFGQRGSLPDNPFKENVIRFSGSITVGERWFYRKPRQ